MNEATPIATLDLTVLDAPDIAGLAEFYRAVLGGEIVSEDPEWITLRAPNGAGMGFQLAPDYRPPTWPDNAVPQQGHLDLNVQDLDAASDRVIALGAKATGLPTDPDSTFRVFLDPAGHPFCLCVGWQVQS